MEKKCKKHQWKKLKEPSVILVDTVKLESAKYNMCKCTICDKHDEIMDRRTRAKVGFKYKLKAKQRYLIGNNGKFAQYMVEEDSLFIIKQPEPKKEDEVEFEEVKQKLKKV